MPYSSDASQSDPGLLASLLRYRWLVAAVTIVMGAGGYLLSAAQPPVYRASSAVLLSDPRDPGLLGASAASRFLDLERYVPQQAARMTSPDVLEMALQNLGPQVTEQMLRQAIDTSVDVDLLQVAVTAERPTALEAATWANAVTEAYATVATQQAEEEAQRAVAAIERQLSDLRTQAEEAEAAAAADPDNDVAASRARILTERIIAIEGNASSIAAEAAVSGSGIEDVRLAVTPEAPAEPDPVRDAAIVAVLSFGLAGAAAYWAAGRDDRVRGAGDAAAVLGVPLLGEIPSYRMPPSTNLAGRFVLPPSAAESFQFLLSSIDFALADIGGRTVMVTSPATGDGKTTAALHLSLAAAREGRDVTLIDGDIRAQGLTRLFGAEDYIGLTDVMSGDAEVDQALRRYRVQDDVVLGVLTAGQRKADPAAASRNGFGRALAELRAESPLVVMDSSPLLAVVDATVAATHVDAVVLIVSPSTSLAQLEKVKERLAFVPTPVIGCVYNRSDSDVAPYDYGYGNDAGRRWWSPRRGTLPQPAGGRGKGSTATSQRARLAAGREA